jgi:hypothetical protein
MTIEKSILDLLVDLTIWLVFLDNTISGYRILWGESKTFGFVIELAITIGRVVLGVEEEMNRRNRLFQSKNFMRLFTWGFWAGTILLIAITISIIVDIVKIIIS